MNARRNAVGLNSASGSTRLTAYTKARSMSLSALSTARTIFTLAMDDVRFFNVCDARYYPLRMRRAHVEVGISCARHGFIEALLE